MWAAFLDSGREPTMAGYEQWLRDTHTRGAHADAVLLHFGSWAEALAWVGAGRRPQEDAVSPPVVQRRRSRPTREAVRMALRDAARDRGGRLTMDGYRDWAKGRWNAPGMGDVRYRYRSWGEACEDAGVPHNPHRRGRRCDGEACRRAVGRFAAEGGPLRRDDYDVWAARHHAPGSATVVDRLGASWRDIVTRRPTTGAAGSPPRP